MAFPTDWLYRKSVTLSRASGAVTNYQMKLLVGESSGAAGENVDCGGLCKTDFSDLRFTKADGTTLLDYWIESVSGATPNQLATVWIEFDSIGTGATTFYMYYGNSGAAAVSSGAGTFPLFDDFERGNNGDAVGGAWTVTTGSVVISTDHAYKGTRALKLVGGGAQPGCTIPSVPSADKAVRMRIWKENAASCHINHGDAAKSAYSYIDASENWNYYDTATRDTGANNTPDSWELFEMNNFNFAGGTYDMHQNDTPIKTGAVMYATGAKNGLIALSTGDAVGNDTYIDNVLVRNWRATEPAWGSWGSQEAVVGDGTVMNSHFFVMLLAGGGR
jgi:hypothetical protein